MKKVIIVMLILSSAFFAQSQKIGFVDTGKVTPVQIDASSSAELEAILTDGIDVVIDLLPRQFMDRLGVRRKQSPSHSESCSTIQVAPRSHHPHRLNAFSQISCRGSSHPWGRTPA